MKHLFSFASGDMKIGSSMKNHISLGQSPREICMLSDEQIFISPSGTGNKLIISHDREQLLHTILSERISSDFEVKIKT